MKRWILGTYFALTIFSWTWAQTTVLDFESAGTSTTFQYFGSGLDGQLTAVVANPDASGINTSANVLEFVKPADAQVWAGAFSNPNPAVAVDLISNTQVCIKVRMDHIGNLALKLENSTNGGSNWIQTQANTKVNEWEELCFDVSLPSVEAPFTPAINYIFTTVTLFFDFGTDGAGSAATNYLDDIVLQPAIQTVTILDFETAGTGTAFQYFGSSLDGQFTNIVANPNASGINTSANVVQFVKPGDAQVWAGAFSNPNPAIPVDLTAGGEVCIKVHMDHIGNLALKLENSTDGGANWIQTQANTVVNGWEELCFNTSLPSIEGPFTAATGHTYTTITLFFDFGTDGAGSAATSYFDDIVVKSAGGVQTANVVLRLNMNNYAGSFTQPYVSGTFNNWSGDGNPMADPDGDGIWEVNLALPVGLYEYKFTLDNWTNQEEFEGTETCTVTDPSGQFVNRRLIVDGDTNGPVFCFNSCYACGDEVSINFQVGMGAVTPSPDGVWLAGGGNFDVPGGRFRLDDSDGDNVYTLTVKRQRGFASFYTFANGNCPDYSCKEDISGQACAQTQNFNDRWLPAVQQDTVVATCFALCANNTACTTGTRNLQQDENLFEVAPSPANDFTVITFGTELTESAQLRLINALGQVVFTDKMNPGTANYRLATSGLTSGLYFIQIETGNRMAIKNVVKNK